jgi:hypothetical protein
MIETNSITHRGSDQLEHAISIENVKAQIQAIQQLMKFAMKEGEHYGVIPGCQKPSLFKSGGEKLGMTFRLAPYYDISATDLPGGHKEYSVTCTLKHIITGQVWGQGVGSCSTMETKWRFRKAEQTCPKCGKPAIIKGKKEYGGGWVCFKSKGGCGAKFSDGDKSIENQEMGRIEHDNPADYHNTCLKMGKKRAHIDAILTSTAASDIFTQDIEDLVDNGVIVIKENSKSNVTPPPSREPRVEPKPSAAEMNYQMARNANALEPEPPYMDEPPPDEPYEEPPAPPTDYNENTADGLKNKIRDKAAEHFPNPPAFSLWLKTLTRNEEKGYRGFDSIDEMRSFKQLQFVYGALQRKMGEK